MKINKFITKQEAANLINSGDTICTVGMTLSGAAECILSAIEERFINSDEPKDITLVHAAGQCDRIRGNAHFAHKGLLKRIIGSHWGLAPRIMEMIEANEIEAFCIPQGQMLHLYTAMAAGLPGRLSKVGLGTFIDPDIEGGRMNELSLKLPPLVEKLKFKGEDYLFYPAIRLDVVIIRGTHADLNGNLTTDEEPMSLELLHAVLAAKRYGAKVIAQVKYQVENHSLHPKRVVVPGNLIDFLVLSNNPEINHRQSSSNYFDPSLCGDIKSALSEAKPLNLDIRKLIGRIACRFISKGDIINLGTGIPNDVVGPIIKEEGAEDLVNITVESGIWGGVQSGGIDFGIGRNLTAMISHTDQMLYYNGTGVDITFMGAGEMDELGNVNATKLGGICPGAGGFIDITQSAKHVIFCSTFSTKGLNIECKDGKLNIIKEGSIRKLVKRVRQISWNAKGSRLKEGGVQKMHFITERAVFSLHDDGINLIAIAPGIDLDKDILSQMDFTPKIASNLKILDAELFLEAPFNLKKFINGEHDVK